MKQASTRALDRAAVHLLACLANGSTRAGASREAKMLLASDLATEADHGIRITEAGRSFLARHAAARGQTGVEPFRAQHGAVQPRSMPEAGLTGPVLVEESESPLAWLARRKGRNGRPLIEPHHFLAGERLRADFTRAQMMPRTTANWEAPVARRQRSCAGTFAFTDATLAARQRMQNALGAVGPEFSGLLLDVCCFLKRLEDVERERAWPPRSAKVVLQLALDRLARHYGLAAQARGKSWVEVTAWAAAKGENETLVHSEAEQRSE